MLVIIGLIVGGVLVGQDLITAAKVRATVTQLEEYSAAAETFRIKYNQLPGDVTAVHAQQFGLQYYPTTYRGYADENGLSPMPTEPMAPYAAMAGCIAKYIFSSCS